MKIKFCILVISIYNLTFSQSNSSKECLEIWTIFTTGNFVNQNAHKIASQDWPFTTKSMAGDVLDEALIEKINKHNRKIWKYLESKGYKNPERKYNEEFTSEVHKIKKAMEMIERQSEVVRLFKKFQQTDLMDYSELRKINDSSYVISIYSFNPLHLNKPPELEIELKADIKNKNVTPMNR